MKPAGASSTKLVTSDRRSSIVKATQVTTTHNATVRVDLTPIGHGSEELHARIRLDEVGLPVEMLIHLQGISADQMNGVLRDLQNVFGDRTVMGTLEDGTPFETQIAFVRAAQPVGSQEIDLLCRCVDGRSAPADPGDTEQAQWRLRLTNLKLHIGDTKTIIPIPEDRAQAPLPEGWTMQPGWSNNRIVFPYAGREWHLTDDLLGTWSGPNQPELHRSVVSGTLLTTFVDGDTEESILELANDIGAALTVAVGRDVKVVSCSRINAVGTTTQTHGFNPGVLAYEDGRDPVVDNWEFGLLRSFIGSAVPVIASDREWWIRTVGLLVQAKASRYLEIRSAILNILVDRISTRVLEGEERHEIDEQLPDKVDQPLFQSQLHQLLLSLSGNWTEERTRALCSTIKEWDARPSFPNKVRRACSQMGIESPVGRQISPRHRLLHVGELETRDNLQYWIDLEGLVVLLIVRMLGHQGLISLRRFGAEPIRVADVVIVEEGEAGNIAEEQANAP